MWTNEDIMDAVIMSTESCPSCFNAVPPPNSILTIPPPPMPAAILSSIGGQIFSNDSNGPCPLLCDLNTGQGIQMNELPHIGGTENDSWLFFAILAIVGLASVLALILLKYKRAKNMDTSIRKKVFNHRTYESILYPKLEENRDLWVTITGNGKGLPEHVAIPPPLPPRVANKSFENSAYSDVEDYKQRYHRRPRVSYPTNIENPNIPPLNYYQSLTRNKYASVI